MDVKKDDTLLARASTTISPASRRPPHLSLMGRANRRVAPATARTRGAYGPSSSPPASVAPRAGDQFAAKSACEAVIAAPRAGSRPRTQSTPKARRRPRRRSHRNASTSLRRPLGRDARRGHQSPRLPVSPLPRAGHLAPPQGGSESARGRRVCDAPAVAVVLACHLTGYVSPIKVRGDARHESTACAAISREPYKFLRSVFRHCESLRE